MSLSSSSQTSTSSRKSAEVSDIRGRGRKSGRATPTISDNISEKAGSSQNSASEHDKSSQVSASDKTKFSQKKKDEGSQNSANLKRRKTADNKLSQESQTNTHTEQTEEQTSTPRAKKSKQMPTVRTPTGRVHTETADSPLLRKSTASSKPRVMFTGYLDKQGEKIVRDLGGELVTSVQECSHLVTDR
ncbi:unnamed protein product, partial [Candidula unifasciata]